MITHNHRQPNRQQTPAKSNVSISESLHALNDIVGDGKSDPWGRWARLSCEVSPSFRTVTLVLTATQYQRRFDKGVSVGQAGCAASMNRSSCPTRQSQHAGRP